MKRKNLPAILSTLEITAKKKKSIEITQRMKIERNVCNLNNFFPLKEPLLL